MRIAIYAGSFDPITRGHEDIIRRSLTFVDRLIIGVATNVAKQALFSPEDRIRFIRAAVDDDPRVEIRHFTGLLVDFAREVGATLSIRGLRAIADFEYEFQMALMNRRLNTELETVFMMPSIDLTYVSSSLVREVARFHGDTSELVNSVVHAALVERFSRA